MKKDVFTRFDSVLQFSNYLDNAKTQPDFKDRESSKDETWEDWYGTPNYNTARDLLLYGDAKSAARVNAAGLSKTIANLQGRAPRSQQFTDIVGGAPCVPNYLVGRPDSMYNTRRPITTAPVVNIVYDCTAASIISTDEIARAAASVLGAVVILENSGARVNLWVAELAVKQKIYVGAVVRVKPADQKINLRKIAYTICHPSFLRRQIFRFVEVTPNVPKSFVSNYGAVVNDNDIINKYLTGVGVRGAIIYDHHADGKTPEQIANEIAATLKRK